MKELKRFLRLWPTYWKTLKEMHLFRVWFNTFFFYLARVQQTAWWITGGLTKNGATTSTEVFNPTSSLPDKMSDGPELPFQIYGHCMLSLKMDTVRYLRNLNVQIQLC